MKKRIISFIIVCLLFLSCLTVLSSADAQLSNANDVITPELREVMNASKAADKIPVSIWTEEIDSAEVEELALKKTGYNKESIRALVEQGKGDTVTLDDVNEYIAVERKLYAEKQQSANQQFAGKYTFLTEAKTQKDAYVCSYAPMIVVSLTKSQIETLAKDSVVNTMYYSPPTVVEDAMDVSLPLTNAKYNRDTSGYTGEDVKIGMIESGMPLNSAKIPYSEDGVPEEQKQVHLDPSRTNRTSHASAVAEILISNDSVYKGIVPDAELYCTSYSIAEGNFFSSVEWLLGRGVNVINMSARVYEHYSHEFGNYSQYERWVDHIAHNHSVHFVKAAGNINDINTNGFVTHPGLAYNIITVGAINDNNTLDNTSDDEICDFSCFLETLNASGGYPPNKPDVVAPGKNIATASDTSSGTSFAAPHVTGIVAQLIEQYPSLAVLQDLMKAMLTAAISHTNHRYTLNQSSTYGRYGAGVVDAQACSEISYRGTFASSAFTASSTTPKTYTFNAPSSAEFVRGSLVWLKSTWYSGSNHTGTPAVDTAIANLSITVITPNGQTLTFNNDGRTNMIIFELDPDVYGYGNYTVRFNTTGSASPTYFGFAWWY